MKQYEGKTLIGIDTGIVSCACAIFKKGNLHLESMPLNYQLNNSMRSRDFIIEVVNRHGGLDNIRAYQEIYIPHKVTRFNLQKKQVEVNALITQQLGLVCRLIKPYEWKKALGTSRGWYCVKPSKNLIASHLLANFKFKLDLNKRYSRHELDAMGILCYGYALDKQEGLL